MSSQLLRGVVALLLLVACGPSGGTGSSTPVVQTNVTSSPAAIGASPSPSSAIQIVQVQINPTDAILELHNTGGPNAATTIDLNNWAVQVETTRVVLPTGSRIAPGQSLLVHTGPAPGSAPSPGASAVAGPSPSPASRPSPGPAASPSTASNQPPVEVYLGPTDGPILRQALQPGLNVDLVDGQNILRSRYTLQRS